MTTLGGGTSELADRTMANTNCNLVTTAKLLAGRRLFATTTQILKEITSFRLVVVSFRLVVVKFSQGLGLSLLNRSRGPPIMVIIVMVITTVKSTTPRR